MPFARSGQLMFRCPSTGADFDSGFAADAAGLAAVPRSAIMSVRCPSCGARHDVNVAEGFIRAEARQAKSA